MEKLLNAKIVQNKEIDASDIDGDKVMMNLEKGMYFSLNSVGSRIWDIIENPTTADEIIKILLNEYDIAEEKCREAVVSFLKGLEVNGLITIC
ncbi:lasso peptide biosynthesis PqqD family chaperone [Clostridium sp.]|uniref:lasso peptide biosynthesis PqqD family chaperone n=1 Tax=Clostridium sp. TaxID=1506 RepID=UPI002A91EF26|nr:lasso peptide biosynthesis PqqD family chaperone [Clostridium sp.]MDY6012183.1 lasso peptide biosynthesis PqqD family chaperone [Clostridium sp.]